MADHVRRELAQPVSSEARDRLRTVVGQAISQIKLILADCHASAARLPSPTRRAYDFLRKLDFDSMAVQADASAAPKGNISLVGVRAIRDYALDRLAQVESPEQLEELHRAVAARSSSVERYVQDHGFRPDDLTASTRAARTWLAFFADRENFDQYVLAMRRAKPCFQIAIRQSRRFRPPAVIHFRPMSGLYQIHGSADGSRVALATPMIAFTDQEFAALAGAVLNGGPRSPVFEALAGEACQAVHAELEALGGVAEQTAGLHHDLNAAFERVRERYFDETLARPRLSWSRTFTGRMFGHYNHVRDRIMVSSTLDRCDVPVYTVDFIMYHELLHKHLGLHWQHDRANAHTPRFRELERRFEQFTEAEAVLRKLADEH